MNSFDYRSIRSVYFVGIAGIGMSALARYFSTSGVQVSGYDRDRSDLAVELEQEGMNIHYEVNTKLVPRWPDVVVYTPAIGLDHPELRMLSEQGIPIMKRSEMLGVISNHLRCIAIAGTHGKTTTSTYAAFAIRKCGLDCTAFLGGLALDFDGNFVAGASDWMVVEADEFDRSFLTLSPELAVITAMDADHLDIYGNLIEMESGFMDFIRKIKQGGTLIIHHPLAGRIDSDTAQWITSRSIRVLTYGVSPDADYQLENIRAHAFGSQFQLQTPDSQTSVYLPVPGDHNALNAAAAIAIGDVLDIDVTCTARSFEGLKGIKRRFELIHRDSSLVVVDDYAHHPEEVKAAISAARKQFAGKRITGVFQPHLYSRTRDFYKEFAAELDELDECVLVDLYPAREEPIEGVSSEMIVEEMKLNRKYCVNKEGLTRKLIEIQPEILLFMGAGDLDRMIKGIIDNLKTD